MQHAGQHVWWNMCIPALTHSKYSVSVQPLPVDDWILAKSEWDYNKVGELMKVRVILHFASESLVHTHEDLL